MNYSDFRVYLWSYISSSTLSYEDRTYHNEDFCEAVCFDAFRLYEQSGNAHIDVICKLVENILFNIKRFNPTLNN